MDKLFIFTAPNWDFLAQWTLLELIQVFPTGNKGGGWFSNGELTFFIKWEYVEFIGDI